MALSTRQRRYLEIALGNKTVAEAVADAIDSGANLEADAVAAIGATSDLSASNVTLSTGDSYTDADVKAAIDSAVDSLGGEVESRLDAIEAKIDAILTALKNADLMAS